MNNFTPIFYKGFWDVPHAFFTSFEDKIFLFRRGYFDEVLDDYPPNYEVYRIKNIALENLPEIWEIYLSDKKISKEKLFVGEVPTRDIIFDETKRKFINCVVFRDLLAK